jgi:hypothetical protein
MTLRLFGPIEYEETGAETSAALTALLGQKKILLISKDTILL